MTDGPHDIAPDRAIVDVRDLGKRYGAVDVLRGCSLTVERGEVVVICGPSGSGKSTLLKCLNGLEPFQAGIVQVDGLDLGRADGRDLARLRARVGMVFQHFELYPHLDVLDNVCLAPVRVLRQSRAEAERRARALLEQVGLAHKEKAFPAELSGGQQQRIAIARGLAMDPVMLLFDEPTSALDPEMVGEVLGVMQGLARGGMTMIVVTHEMGFARRAAHRVVFMDEGRILEVAPTEAFFRRPRSERARMFLSRVLSH